MYAASLKEETSFHTNKKLNKSAQNIPKNGCQGSFLHDNNKCQYLFTLIEPKEKEEEEFIFQECCNYEIIKIL